MNQVQKAIDIPGMAWQNIVNVKKVEEWSQRQPQISLPVQHHLHAGMYVRTIRIPSGVMITGALVKIPTILIFNGDCGVYIGNEFVRLQGYKVLAAAPNRKQIFLAKKATDLTMCFPTDAKTVKEAEEQFTDEVYLLQPHEG